MAYIDFEEIKRLINIPKYCEFKGQSLKQRGKQWRGHCILCDSTNPRSFVYTEDKGWYCHNCQRGGGDVISLAKIKENHRSNKDAAQALSSEFYRAPERPESERKVLSPLDYLDAEHSALKVLQLSADTYSQFEGGYAPKGLHRGKLALPIRTLSGALTAYVGINLKDMSLHYPKGYDPAEEEAILNIGNIGLDVEDLILTNHPVTMLRLYELGLRDIICPLFTVSDNIDKPALASVLALPARVLLVKELDI